VVVLCVVAVGAVLVVAGRSPKDRSPVVEVRSRPSIGEDLPRISAPPALPALATTSTTPMTTTTAPGVTEVEGRGQPTPLTARHPIVAELPYDAPNFRIDYRADGGRLVLRIRLRALQLRDAGTPSVEEQLAAYKAQALAWLGERGVLATTYPIEWDPPRAGQL